MKKITFLTAVFCIVFSPVIFAQWSPWSEPTPITGNDVNNREGTIYRTVYNGSESNYLFWIKEVSADVSGIFMRDIYDSSATIEVIPPNGSLCRNPRVVSGVDFSTLQTNFVLFYESNESGNFDLYYVTYDGAGFSEIAMLSGSDSDENHFRCSTAGRLVWEAGGSIYYTEMDESINFSAPLKLDSLSCSSPGIMPGEFGYSYQYVTWKRTIFDGEEVYYKRLHTYTGTWDESILIASPYEVGSLEFANNTFLWDNPILFWENKDIDGYSTIYGYDIQGEDYFMTDFSRYGDFHVAAFLSYIPVKYFHIETFMAFENVVEGHSDVFVNPESWLSPDSVAYPNLTDTITEDIHPAFFLGGPVGIGYWDLWLIWEKEVDGKFQIYGSSTIIGGSGIGENADNSFISDARVYPNPCDEQFEISFNASDRYEIAIDLLDYSGKLIDHIVDREFSKGEHHLAYDLSGSRSKGLPSGLYFLKFDFGEASWMTKVIVK